MATYCHVEGKDDISHEGKRGGSVRTLGPIVKGENEARNQEAYVGILESRVDHFDDLSTDGRRDPEGICQDKERDEEVALDNTKGDKLGCEPKFD